MCPLAKTDYSRSHLPVLSVLAIASDPGVGHTQRPLKSSGLEAYSAASDKQRLSPSTYFAFVMIHKPTDPIVAVGRVFIEQKFVSRPHGGYRSESMHAGKKAGVEGYLGGYGD